MVLATLLVLGGCSTNEPAPAAPPSTLVSVIAPHRGSLPAIVTAYGSAGASVDGVQTLSEAQPGQITALQVKPGMTVHTGQALATFVVAAMARSNYQQATNAVIAASKQRNTTAQLLGQQLATQDQLIQADKALADARSALSALRADGAGQAAATLVAPFDGLVTTVGVAQGDRIQPGAAILTIARNGSAVITAGIDTADRAMIRAGQVATLQRLTGGNLLVGRVLRIDSLLNPLTRMVGVDIAFSAGALLPGEAMKAAIETGQVTGWIVPHQAVVTAGGKPRVFQVMGNKARAVPVQIALASDQGDVVIGAIDAHAPLIVEGAYQVGDGALVRRSN